MPSPTLRNLHSITHNNFCRNTDLWGGMWQTPPYLLLITRFLRFARQMFRRVAAGERAGVTVSINGCISCRCASLRALMLNMAVIHWYDLLGHMNGTQSHDCRCNTFFPSCLKIHAKLSCKKKYWYQHLPYIPWYYMVLNQNQNLFILFHHFSLRQWYLATTNHCQSLIKGLLGSFFPLISMVSFKTKVWSHSTLI